MVFGVLWCLDFGVFGFGCFLTADLLFRLFGAMYLVLYLCSGVVMYVGLFCG